MPDSTQPLSAKIGEVTYRAALHKQHCGTNHLFKEEYSKAEMRKIIDEKVKTHRQDFAKLKKHFLLSPFLEIGAGYGQSSLVVQNEYKATGYALDLAIAPLQSTPATAKRLGYKIVPTLLVADAEKLPFANNSFPFVFCYQTLHHFPHPKKVIEEIHRVLQPGGLFYFGEEPVRQEFGLRLWNRPTKLRWWERVLKATLILPFLSKIGKTEIDHGILEEAFSLQMWKEALDIFPDVSVNLSPFPYGFKGLLERVNRHWNTIDPVTRLTLIQQFFTGGGIGATAVKAGRLPAKGVGLPPLVCPDCRQKLNVPKYKTTKWFCSRCKIYFPIKNTVHLVLPPDLLKQLYS